MNYDENGSCTDPKQTTTPRPAPGESDDSTGWLDALNSFLDRALKADIDTGC